MKYSYNTWSYSDFPCWVPSYSFEETVKRLARIGYDAIEIGCAQPHAWPYYIDDARRQEMKQALEANGIAVSAMLPAPGGGPGSNIASPLKAERDWTVQYWKDCMDLGLALGCKTLLCVCGWYAFGTRRRDAWEWAKDSLKQVAQYAEGKGVTMCLEPTATDSNLIECADDAIEMMEQVDSPNVALMFDTAHATYRNEPAADYVYTMGENLKYIHMTDYDRLAPGTNGLDFVTIMQALKDIGYGGYVTMETGFPHRGADPDSVARKSLENLKAIEASLK